MREYAWKEERFRILFPDCATVLATELMIDWVKHAFITRFNDIPLDVYKDFTTSLAYDLADTKQKYAHTDHSDVVARRMGFIPIPLAVLVIRIAYQTTNFTHISGFVVLFFFYFTIFTFKILNNIVLLGKACQLIDAHQKPSTVKKTESVNVPFLEEVERDALIGLKGRSKSVCSLPVEPIENIPRSPKGRSLSQSPVRRRKVRICEERTISVDCQNYLDDEIPGRLDRDTSTKPMFYNSTVSLQSVKLNRSMCEQLENDSCDVESSFDSSGNIGDNESQILSSSEAEMVHVTENLNSGNMTQ